ncbi:MAG: DUF1206 domain-containing protein [Pseudonocardiales bacterium]
MSGAMGVGRDVRNTARQAASSKWLGRLARLGLVARGVTYLLVGWLALQVALGNSGKQADRGGAVQEIASKPFGSALLWLLGIGLLGLALWRFAEAAFGRDTGDRLKSLARGVLYAGFAVTTFTYVLGKSSSAAANSNQQSVGATAKIMKHSGGRVLIVAVGLVLIAIGCYMIYEGAKKKFEDELNLGRMSRRTRQVVEKLGMYGGIARGAVFGLAGLFLVIAAVKYDPGKAKGLDGTLRSFATTPLGPWLLAVVALGLVAFGLFSLCEARWRRV